MYIFDVFHHVTFSFGLCSTLIAHVLARWQNDMVESAVFIIFTSVNCIIFAWLIVLVAFNNMVI